MLRNENLVFISHQQANLDQYILSKNQLVNDQTMFKKKVVAFLVELGEYANEERSFKYWSKKDPSTLKIQLAEYIDGLHFLMSLGNDLHFDFANYDFQPLGFDSQVDTYLQLVEDLSLFLKETSCSCYEKILNDFFTIAKIANYSELDLLEAYQIKNQVNFDRQNQNY